MGNGSQARRHSVSTAPVICNSSPLIALEQIGHLHLLDALFDEIWVPPAVVNEVAAEAHLRPEELLPEERAYLREHALKKPLRVTFIHNGVPEEGVDEGGVSREFFQLLVGMAAGCCSRV